MVQIFWAKDSIINVKIRGVGHPCLVPLVMANGSERVSSEKTQSEGLEYRMAEWQREY